MVFVFDLDGTICFDGKHIPIEIQHALEQLMAQGHQLVFASARPIRDLLPLLSPTLQQAILIGGNGSITQVNQYITAQKPISHAAFMQIKQWIAELDLDYLADDLWHYSKRIRQAHTIEHKIDCAKLAQNQPLFAIRHPIKTILLNLTLEQYTYLTQQLANMDLTIIEHTEENGLYNLDITAKQINKYRTLTHVIDQQAYIAFGNDMNDRELLTYASYAVCVGNCQALQAISNVHLPANPACVAEKIRQFLEAKEAMFDLSGSTF